MNAKIFLLENKTDTRLERNFLFWYFCVECYVSKYYVRHYVQCVQTSMCDQIPVYMNDRKWERESMFHHPVNSHRSELSYPPPTSERERERESHATARRREEETVREGGSEDAHALVSSSRQVDRTPICPLTPSSSHSAVLRLSPRVEESSGARGQQETRMVNNLTECEEGEGAANSQGEWRNLSRCHHRSHAHTISHVVERTDGVRGSAGHDRSSLLSRCMAAVSGIVMGYISCVCVHAPTHIVCVHAWYTNTNDVLEEESLFTVTHQIFYSISYQWTKMLFSCVLYNNSSCCVFKAFIHFYILMLCMSRIAAKSLYLPSWGNVQWLWTFSVV